MPLRYACTSTPSSTAVGMRVVGDEREREVRLGELLLGVVHVARVADVGLARRARRRPRRGRRRPPRSAHGLRGTRAGARHGSRCARPDGLPRRRQRDLARPVLELEDVARRRRRRLRSVRSGPLASAATRSVAAAPGGGRSIHSIRSGPAPSRRYGAGAGTPSPRKRTLVRCSCAWCLIWMSRNTYADERDVGEQVQQEERRRTRVDGRDERDRHGAAEHEQHVAAALLRGRHPMRRTRRREQRALHRQRVRPVVAPITVPAVRAPELGQPVARSRRPNRCALGDCARAGSSDPGTRPRPDPMTTMTRTVKCLPSPS